ncbi:MAG TPA: hypothetical protein VM305_03090 [Candidatus Limnocylindrales bacterium]|nr:hypothetical protein [Candidatus Limnocylindrales bacterium]
MTADEELSDHAAQAEARAEGDLAGPGTGGSPNPGGRPDEDDRREAIADADVARLTENLRSDADGDGDVRSTHTKAAEQAGTGTDR